MTPRPMTPKAEAGEIIPFPDAPPEELTAFFSINFPGYPPSLAEHFGNPETTIILSEVAAALIPTRSYEGVLYPDLLIAFDVHPHLWSVRNGYLIPEQGKPPDFVMEVASESTARRDETLKREAYAAMGVPEYWRFDSTGGRRYSTHLAGDRLVDGIYVPITIHRTDDEHLWGHSDSLDLDLCWEEGDLRFWDPVAQRYLHTFMEESAARREAEARAAMAETRADAAETRVRQLEEELRRRQNS